MTSATHQHLSVHKTNVLQERLKERKGSENGIAIAIANEDNVRLISGSLWCHLLKLVTLS